MAAQKSPLNNYNNKLSLSEIFNKEVTRALEDYPHLRGRFAFVNNADGTAIYDIDPSTSGFSSQRQLERFLHETAALSSQRGPLSTKDPWGSLDVIAYSPINAKLFTRGADSAEKEALAIFDHELGHLIVKGSMASGDPCYRECAADAFSIIRHMQRYGTETDIIEICTWKRAFDFIMSGRSEHFTTLAIDELDRLKKKIDFKEMTPVQIKDLAMRVALNHTPHPDIINRVNMIFAPVRRTYAQTHNLEQALRTLAEITLDYKDDYHVFKIGSTVLQSFMDGKVSNNKGPLELGGPGWDQVRAEIKGQTDNLARNHILMGMPIVGQETPPPSLIPPPPASWKNRQPDAGPPL